MANKQILLVDDSALDREMALGALQQSDAGDDVVSLRDGAEALDYLFRRGEFAGRTGPDPVVVLLDLKMPRVDGLEVLRQVKTDPKLKVVPIVMMTSSSEERDLTRSYEFGVNAYVVKPLAFQDFLASIRSLAKFWTELNEPPPRQATGA